MRRDNPHGTEVHVCQMAGGSPAGGGGETTGNGEDRSRRASWTVPADKITKLSVPQYVYYLKAPGRYRLEVLTISEAGSSLKSAAAVRRHDAICGGSLRLPQNSLLRCEAEMSGQRRDVESMPMILLPASSVSLLSEGASVQSSSPSCLPSLCAVSGGCSSCDLGCWAEQQEKKKKKSCSLAGHDGEQSENAQEEDEAEEEKLSKGMLLLSNGVRRGEGGGGGGSPSTVTTAASSEDGVSSTRERRSTIAKTDDTKSGSRGTITRHDINTFQGLACQQTSVVADCGDSRPRPSCPHHHHHHRHSRHSSLEAPSAIAYRKLGELSVQASGNRRGGMRFVKDCVLGRFTSAMENVPLYYIPLAIRRWFSRQHCSVSWVTDGLKSGEASFYVQDLNSSNGTFLNGRKLPAQVPVCLKDGDCIGVSADEDGLMLMGFRFHVSFLSCYVKGLEPPAWNILNSGTCQDGSSSAAPQSCAELSKVNYVGRKSMSGGCLSNIPRPVFYSPATTVHTAVAGPSTSPANPAEEPRVVANRFFEESSSKVSSSSSSSIGDNSGSCNPRNGNSGSSSSGSGSSSSGSSSGDNNNNNSNGTGDAVNSSSPCNHSNGSRAPRSPATALSSSSRVALRTSTSSLGPFDSCKAERSGGSMTTRPSPTRSADGSSDAGDVTGFTFVKFREPLCSTSEMPRPQSNSFQLPLSAAEVRSPSASAEIAAVHQLSPSLRFYSPPASPVNYDDATPGSFCHSVSQPSRTLKMHSCIGAQLADTTLAVQVAADVLKTNSHRQRLTTTANEPAVLLQTFNRRRKASESTRIMPDSVGPGVGPPFATQGEKEEAPRQPHRPDVVEDELARRVCNLEGSVVSLQQSGVDSGLAASRGAGGCCRTKEREGGMATEQLQSASRLTRHDFKACAALHQQHGEAELPTAVHCFNAPQTACGRHASPNAERVAVKKPPSPSGSFASAFAAATKGDGNSLWSFTTSVGKILFRSRTQLMRRRVGLTAPSDSASPPPPPCGHRDSQQAEDKPELVADEQFFDCGDDSSSGSTLGRDGIDGMCSSSSNSSSNSSSSSSISSSSSASNTDGGARRLDVVDNNVARGEEASSSCCGTPSPVPSQGPVSERKLPSGVSTDLLGHPRSLSHFQKKRSPPRGSPGRSCGSVSETDLHHRPVRCLSSTSDLECIPSSLSFSPQHERASQLRWQRQYSSPSDTFSSLSPCRASTAPSASSYPPCCDYITGQQPALFHTTPTTATTPPVSSGSDGGPRTGDTSRQSLDESPVKQVAVESVTQSSGTFTSELRSDSVCPSTTTWKRRHSSLPASRDDNPDSRQEAASRQPISYFGKKLTEALVSLVNITHHGRTVAARTVSSTPRASGGQSVYVGSPPTPTTVTANTMSPSSSPLPHCHAEYSNPSRGHFRFTPLIQNPLPLRDSSPGAPPLSPAHSCPPDSPAVSPVDSPAVSPSHSPAHSPAQSPAYSSAETPANFPPDSPPARGAAFPSTSHKQPTDGASSPNQMSRQDTNCSSTAALSRFSMSALSFEVPATPPGSPGTQMRHGLRPSGSPGRILESWDAEDEEVCPLTLSERTSGPEGEGRCISGDVPTIDGWGIAVESGEDMYRRQGVKEDDLSGAPGQCAQRELQEKTTRYGHAWWTGLYSGSLGESSCLYPRSPFANLTRYASMPVIRECTGEASTQADAQLPGHASSSSCFFTTPLKEPNRSVSTPPVGLQQHDEQAGEDSLGAVRCEGQSSYKRAVRFTSEKLAALKHLGKQS